MRTLVPIVVAIVAMAATSSCKKSPLQYRATIRGLVAGDISNPLAVEGSVSTNLVARQMELVESEQVLGGVADDLKLDQRWSMPRTEAVGRLKDRIYVRSITSKSKVVEGAAVTWNAEGFELSVVGDSESEAEELAKAIAQRFKQSEEAIAGKEIAKRLATLEKELEETQEKATSLRSQSLEAQTNSFVPSKYRMSKEFEAELRGRIRAAAADESERARQLESLRKLEGEDLRNALLKIEMARRARPDVATNESVSVSVLISANQAQRTAEQELTVAKSGVVTETNAVPHAELKLELAHRNLTNSMAAYLKSLEIEWEVSKGRREGLEGEAAKLLETSQRSEQKTVVEKELESLQKRLADLTNEIERWKLCQRILGTTIRVGEPRLEPVR